MSLHFTSPQGALWLTDGQPSLDRRNMLVWGKYWLDRLYDDHEEINDAWIGLAGDPPPVQWVAGLTSASMPPQFSGEKCREVMERGREFVFKDHRELISGVLFPLIQGGRKLGILGLTSGDTDYFKPATIKWLRTFTRLMVDSLVAEVGRTGTAEAEYSIAKNLLVNLDVIDSLPSVLKILAEILGADALTALRYVPFSDRFELIESYGLAHDDLAKLRFHFDAGLAGKSLGQDALWIRDMQDRSSGQRPVYRLDEVGFRGYLALPLITHGHLVGALEIAWRTPCFTKTWREGFLERVSEQLALAMEHTHILGEVRRNNVEVTTKYNAMIEGLSRSLELRDLETEGHTRRVSELTGQLVKHMKIPADQWDAIRQGALLHDIGKLGIPDSILLKPGSLTPREQKVMQQHVIYGYNILSPAINERHTLDITLYHHEHWDGTGYPYGLKGGQIPLMARVFAVVDVFDALTSDRPYRTAWSRSQVIEYLKEQSGRNFDPQVVRFFLEVIKE